VKKISIVFDPKTNQLNLLVAADRRFHRQTEAALREIAFVLKKTQQVKKAIVEKRPLTEPVLA